jgi:IclR family KDG regulon transcriptional repressor
VIGPPVSPALCCSTASTRAALAGGSSSPVDPDDCACYSSVESYSTRCEMEEDRGVKAIQRAADLLDYLAEHPLGASLAELSDGLSLPKSSIHRILSVLVKNRLVREDKATSLYLVGFGVFKFSQAVIAGFNIAHEARPFLLHLNHQLDETVHLGIIDPGKPIVIYLDKIESTQAIRLVSRVGQAVPVHCTALGKVMLSFMREDEQERVIGACDFKAYTANTIVTADALKRDLSAIRSSGHAIDAQEHELGVICVAAPVLNSKNDVLAAISVSAPADRMPPSRIPEVADLAIAAARGIGDHVSLVPYASAQ